MRARFNKGIDRIRGTGKSWLKSLKPSSKAIGLELNVRTNLVTFR